MNLGVHKYLQEEWGNSLGMLGWLPPPCAHWLGDKVGLCRELCQGVRKGQHLDQNWEGGRIVEKHVKRWVEKWGQFVVPEEKGRGCHGRSVKQRKVWVIVCEGCGR